jgi:uncharacterized protein (TIGR00251 family)
VKKASPKSKLAGTDVTVKVISHSSRPGIVGWENEVLKVKVGAAPVDGLANKALVSLVALKLGIGEGRVEVVSGKSSRMKTVRIQGLSQREFKSGLASS